jgi:hypothetical protein
LKDTGSIIDMVQESLYGVDWCFFVLRKPLHNEHLDGSEALVVIQHVDCPNLGMINVGLRRHLTHFSPIGTFTRTTFDIASHPGKPAYPVPPEALASIIILQPWRPSSSR